MEQPFDQPCNCDVRLSEKKTPCKYSYNKNILYSEIHVGQQVMVIIAGDFILNMDKELDSMNINKPKTRLKVFNLIENWDLKNGFREIYPEKKRYSWRKKTPVKQARLDFFLLSEFLIPPTVSVEYENSYRSDHSPVFVKS